MAGLIPQSFIDTLLDRVDIVEVIDHRVKLKKTGKNYSACCPFHEERTPSFTVSPDKQFYYCFGCGASGNALGFVMDYERLAFPEAVEQMARSAGLEVPREAKSEIELKKEQEKRSIYSLLEKADLHFQSQLRQHPSKQIAIGYLKNRGLTGQIAKQYGIGFAPPGWDNLLKALAKGEEDKRFLIEGGMLVHHKDENKLYDRFRHRIMFPIRDTRGRVIGFGGRVLGDDKPKYLNSPETPVFHKSQELYGLYEARLAYRELPRLLVVEGYMDVVSLAQYGIRYGVATLGTACGEDHLIRAFRHTQEVVFCFDGDQAGRTAALRALEASLPVMADGRTVKFLFLPDGEDPDTLIRQIGAEKFSNKIDMAVPLEDFLFDAVADGLNIRTMEGRATFSKRAAPLLAKLPKGVFKELMFESLAARTGLSRPILQELIEASAGESETMLAPPIPSQPSATLSAPATTAAPSTTRHANTERDYYYGNPPEQEQPPADYESYYQDFTPVDRPMQRQLAPQAPSRYLMPPAHKAIALVFSHPELAAHCESPQLFLETENESLMMLGRLIKLLKERPHYQASHIIGYWRASFGAENTEQLVKLASQDLLRATVSISAEREDKTAKANYNNEQAFIDCLATLDRLDQERRSADSLSQLRSKDIANLSTEERNQLLRDILASKANPKNLH